MSEQHQSFRIIVIDDNDAIHNDFDNILTPEQDDDLSDLEADLFGDGDDDDVPKQTAATVEFKLDHATQGKPGWEMIKEGYIDDNPFALAFVDMRMPPGWDGLETIEHIVADDPDIQIVICTAFSDHNWSDLHSRLGTTDRLLILKKPADSMEIRQIAHALTYKWKLGREQAQQMAKLDELVKHRTAALEEEIQKRDQVEMELRMAQKLEAVGQLASGIAHEINTPIQFIGDSVHFLQSAFTDFDGLLNAYREAASTHLSEDQRTTLKENEEEIDLEFLNEQAPLAFERTLDGIGRVSAIVRAMKEFAHPDTAEKTAMNVQHAIETMLTVAKSEYKYIADVETEFADVPDVMCHPGEINQVLLNLVINAAHAIEDDRKGTDERGTILITTTQTEEYIEIRIKDDGQGIPQEVQDRIFEPFYTTKEVGRGSGQGLPIARSIICEKHNGDLRFETEQGVGTTFIISLPTQAAEKEQAA